MNTNPGLEKLMKLLVDNWNDQLVPLFSGHIVLFVIEHCSAKHSGKCRTEVGDIVERLDAAVADHVQHQVLQVLHMKLGWDLGYSQFLVVASIIGELDYFVVENHVDDPSRRSCLKLSDFLND